MGLRWEGFRKVRRQVCRRIRRRLDALGLADLDTYRAHLEAHPGEWALLDSLTAITISRFARDRGVFEALAREVVPALAAGRDRLRVWSAGCASGEEPYTLALLQAERATGVQLEILATDVDANVLRRAEEAAYGWGSLKELPEAWRARGFVRRDGLYVLRPEFRRPVTLRRHDVASRRRTGRSTWCCAATWHSRITPPRDSEWCSVTSRTPSVPAARW
jgi:chemotaxis protein methyltransferase CheR